MISEQDKQLHIGFRSALNDRNRAVWAHPSLREYIEAHGYDPNYFIRRTFEMIDAIAKDLRRYT